MKKEILRLPVTSVDARGRGRGKTVAGDNTERNVFVTGAYPGDIVDIRVRRQKGSWLGDVQSFHAGTGPDRRQPFCRHFAECGGCTIQDLSYSDQLVYKEQIVRAVFQEYPDLTLPEVAPILGSSSERYYRNKLEFSFGAMRWLSDNEIRDADTITDRRGLGFHAGGRFDRVIDLQECYLQPEPSETIRKFFRELSVKENLTFYDAREHCGLMRLLMVRTSLSGETMLIVMFGEDVPEQIETVMAAVHREFPDLTSLNYIINTSKNDSIGDRPVHLYAGARWITEQCGPNSLRIRPRAFYQTNPEQAVRLYRRALEMAELQGDETVFDLYCGIGSIALFVSPSVKNVVGIEVVEDAVTAARENAGFNDIENVTFVAGQVEAVLPEVIELHGTADVVFLDPPRAGLHPGARKTLLQLAARRIVYISCNPRTQAADIAVLSELYDVSAVQPVDMFPQTRHVENIVVLDLRK